MLLNGSALNATALNGSASSGGGEDYDWEALAPVERQTIYQAKVGEMLVPVSSFQSTMRLAGQSFVQLVVPGGDAYIDDLEAIAAGSPMTVAKGYRYFDGSLSPLETIAQASFDGMRPDEGTRGITLTLSGYAPFEPAELRVRNLRGVRYRSMPSGRRRVRCEIDIFLRPGDTVVDTDGTEFTVATIQHFVGPSSEAMEVLQDG